MRKFVRRHKGQVIATAAALIASMAGLGAIAVVQRAANIALAAKNDELTKANERVTTANAALETANSKVQARYDLAVDAIKTYHTGCGSAGQLYAGGRPDPVLPTAAGCTD